MPLHPAPYAAPIAVTLAYGAVYYASMLNVVRTKYRLAAEHRARRETFDRYFGQDRQMLAADRIQLNALEHMPLFLTLLWLDAVFVGPRFAGLVGGVYVAARALYPWLLGTRVGPMQRKLVLLATGPSYLALLTLAAALAWTLVR